MIKIRHYDQRGKGRPQSYGDNDVLVIDTSQASTVLQKNSDRRAVLNAIIDKGGRATITELDLLFTFDTRPIVRQLCRLGYLAVLIEDETQKL